MGDSGFSSEIQRVTLLRLDIQFRDLRSIPQAAPWLFLAVARNDHAIRVRGGNQSVGAEIKSLKNLPAGSREKNYIIRKIVCDQKSFTHPNPALARHLRDRA